MAGAAVNASREYRVTVQTAGPIANDKHSKSIEEAAKEPLRPDHLTQIVDAIRVADIPTELGHQIDVLKSAATLHGARNEELLQKIEQIRTNLDDHLVDLERASEGLKQLAVNKDTSETTLGLTEGLHRSIAADVFKFAAALQARNKDLTKNIEKQNCLLVAHKKFLEEMATAPEVTPMQCEENANKNNEQSSWPYATLRTVQLAITTLSAVVLSVTAFNVAQKDKRAT